MDDEDGYGSGLSGFAWHELGRQAERSQQVQARAVSAFAARLRGEVPVNVGALVAENQALWQQNKALWQRIHALQAEVQDRYLDYRDLRAWGDTIHAELLRLQAEKRTSKEQPSGKAV